MGNTEKIIKKSNTPDELLAGLKALDQDDKIDTLNPHLRSEVERTIRQDSPRYLGRAGIGGFSL